MGNSTYKVLTDSTLDTCKFNKKLFYLNFALILVHVHTCLKGSWTRKQKVLESYYIQNSLICMRGMGQDVN